MITRAVPVGSVTFGAGAPFALIAGPCVIEGREHCVRHAQKIGEIAASLRVPFVFKSSFDKANRSSGSSFRGPGIEEGLRILEDVRRMGFPVLTDVHDAAQALAVGEVVDCLQIPAFLCRQTDLLLAAASTGRAVNVKKGQFLAPQDAKNILEKLRPSNNDKILLTERGVCFGYHALVVDFTGLPVMRALGAPVIFDATHAVQSPGGLGTKTGGDRTKVPYLARAAVAVGIDGLFMEVHEDPDHAPSDGPNMVALRDLRGILEDCLRIQDALAGSARE
jgi:2-dehydro-3-deoxyphosphooctonate aldolase (KDO 8-P synthase)